MLEQKQSDRNDAGQGMETTPEEGASSARTEGRNALWQGITGGLSGRGHVVSLNVSLENVSLNPRGDKN